MKDNTKELASAVVKALDDKKAVDIKVLDISEISPIADYFVIASGTNSSQIQALADAADETLGRLGLVCKSNEGYRTAHWILLDFGDIVVHVFDEESRVFYDLERIWRDGKEISAEELLAE